MMVEVLSMADIKFEEVLRRCKKCKEMKYVSDFSRDSSQKGGRKFRCKKCQNLENRVRRNGTEEYKKKIYLADENGKTCGKCLIKKPVTGFHPT
jgi:hypothetical protein